MAGASRTMAKVSVRNILAHKLRLALTVLAVVLGTAFIAGASMFTNSLSNTFDSAVSTAFDGVDVAATAPMPGGAQPAPAAGPGAAAAANQPKLTTEIRDRLAADPDVERVAMGDGVTVVLAHGDGKAIQTGGAPTVASPWYEENQAVGQAPKITEGSAPVGDQVAVSKTAGKKAGLKPGDQVIIVDADSRHTVTVAGLFDAATDKAGGMMFVQTPEPTFIERYSKGGQIQKLYIKGKPGTNPDQLVKNLQQRHPDVHFDTGKKLADEASKSMSSMLSFLNYFLIAFGLVALLVGTFIIANTFSMIVAQRTREFALLRAMGADRSQVTNSVVLEAAIVGLVGSALGVVAGMGLVQLIRAVSASQGMELGSGLGLTPVGVIVPIILGLIVTVVSAWLPARRAGAVQPVEAMRTTESAAGASLVVRSVIGINMLAGGIIAALVGVWLEHHSTGGRATLVGLGAFGIIVGFFLASPALSIPIVPTIGRVFGFPFRSVGKLAATNSKRNPRRTAATAFALTLGVALVAAIGMFGASTKASLAHATEEQVTADYVAAGPSNASIPFPNDAVDVVRHAPGVGQSLAMGFAPVKVGQEIGNPMAGGAQYADGDPAAMFKLTLVNGQTDLAGKPGVLVSEKVAKKENLAVGQNVPVASAITKQQIDVPVVGVFKDQDLLGDTLVSKDAVAAVMPKESVSVQSVMVRGDGSVSKDQLRQNLEKAVSDYIVVQIKDSKDMTGEVGKIVDTLLNVLYGLLALAVIVAILGIINTLTLNVIERRQEIGMLRAVGTHRRQIRIMITLEAVQIAVFGAVMGIAIGLFLGWAFLKVLSSNGLSDITVPTAQVVAMLLGSAVVGVIAALFPAIRAAKTPPLDAITDE